MSQIGLVIGIDGDRVDVSTTRRGACSGCSEAGSCGVGGPEELPTVVTAENRAGARLGDTVELDLPEGAALRLSLLVWVLPLVGLLGGAVGGHALAPRVGLGTDAGTLLGALAGAGLAFAGLRRVDRRFAAAERAGDGHLAPFVARVVARAGEAGDRREAVHRCPVP